MKDVVDASEAQRMLETLVSTGLRDQKAGWRLACALTANFPEDQRIDQLRKRVVDLLVAIEIETILGGALAHHQEQLQALLSWAAKHLPERSA